MTVPVEQAAQSALARWLARELSGVTIWDRWPEPDVRLPARAISVLRAGTRRDEPLDLEPIARRDLEGVPGRALYRWRVRACTQPLQLDVWATSDVGRGELLARLEPALNASKARSMPELHLANADPIEHGLALVLDDGWEGSLASYWFDEPATTDTPDSVQRSEYRATYRGWAAMNLTLEAESRRLARAQLRLRLDGQNDSTTR